MSAITRILCAVDFSECSRHALEQAIMLGRESHPPVFAVHAFAVAPVTEHIMVGAPIVVEPARGSRELRTAVRSELEHFAGSVDAGGAVLQLELAEGDPRILCAVDFSTASLRALQYAADLAPGTGAELCAMHVVELITGDAKGTARGYRGSGC